MEDVKSSPSKKTPPYVSYATFSTALASLCEHGLPPTLDRSVLKQFSGLNQTLLLSAFRYVGLTNEQYEPAEEFQAFVKPNMKNERKYLGS